MAREHWDDGLDWSYEKYAQWVVYGPRIAPVLASEILRRTDSIFISGGGYSPCVQNIQRLLGLPSPDNFPGNDVGYLDALRRYVTKWGLLGAGHEQWLPIPMLLENRMASDGRGWCYPDGTIALVGEVKRGYPDSIFSECECLAQAFPELRMSVAYWGRAGVGAPTIGFKVADGRAIPTRGDDPALFGEFGRLMYWSTIGSTAERAAQEALSLLPTTSRFGDLTPDDRPGQIWRGVPDDIIDVWLEKARSLGLVS